MFFFFQAEDGIRDIGVTGVQTCALPIYPVRDAVEQRDERAHRLVEEEERARDAQRDLLGPDDRVDLRDLLAGGDVPRRSEESRVGKEWRSRWSPYHLKKKIRGTPQTRAP